MEHQGPGPMPPVTSIDCAACHNDRAIMQASAQRGKQLPRIAFSPQPEGREPDESAAERAATAATGGRLHGHVCIVQRRASAVSTAARKCARGGRAPLQSSAAHERAGHSADARRRQAGLQLLPQAGAERPLHAARQFEANCQECHSLQFDVKNPDFQLPHGDAQLVRTFLRTCRRNTPNWRGANAASPKEARVNAFTAQQISGLLAQFSTADQTGAHGLLHEGSLSGTAAAGFADPREIRRLRLLPRSEADERRLIPDAADQRCRW